MTKLTMNSIGNPITTPAFITKLWNMVEDSTTDDIICWSKNGKQIIIRDEKQFWYKMLPVYYKHSNMSSFVRQLNMYGFRKIPNLIECHLNVEERVDYQFSHPYFQKGKIELLKNIKRKAAGAKNIPNVNRNEDSPQFNKLHSDVKSLHNRQNQVDTVLNNLKQENAVLWRELAVLRQKHQKQGQIVNKLIQFLVTLVQPSTRLGGVGSTKRKQFMIKSGAHKIAKSNSGGPTIHELDNSELPLIDVPLNASPIGNVQIPEVEFLSELELPEDTNNSLTSEIPEGLDKKIGSPASQEPDLLDFSTPDSFLSDLISGSFSNVDQNCANIKKERSDECTAADNNSVATCSNSASNTWMNAVGEDIDRHVGITHNELEQIKKIFSGSNSLDAKYLLQLFNEGPSYGLTSNESWDTSENPTTVIGTELAPYDPEIIDFDQLLDDGIESTDFPDLPQSELLDTSELELKPSFSLDTIEN